MSNHLIEIECCCGAKKRIMQELTERESVIIEETLDLLTEDLPSNCTLKYFMVKLHKD